MDRDDSSAQLSWSHNLRRVPPTQDPPHNLEHATGPERELHSSVAQCANLLRRMPLTLADVRRLVGAEADDDGHRLLPHHAEGLGLVALGIEAPIDLERLLEQLELPDAIDG